MLSPVGDYAYAEFLSSVRAPSQVLSMPSLSPEAGVSPGLLLDLDSITQRGHTVC